MIEIPDELLRAAAFRIHLQGLIEQKIAEAPDQWRRLGPLEDW